MKYNFLSIDELLHYGELGEVPGIEAPVAKYIREKLGHYSTATNEQLEAKIVDLEESIKLLEDTLDDIAVMAKG